MTLRGIHSIVLSEREVVPPTEARAALVAIGGLVVSERADLPAKFTVEVDRA